MFLNISYLFIFRIYVRNLYYFLSWLFSLSRLMDSHFGKDCAYPFMGDEIDISDEILTPWHPFHTWSRSFV